MTDGEKPKDNASSPRLAETANVLSAAELNNKKRDSSTAQADTPEKGVEEKIGLLRSE
ncbi:MAG TPA: hypothetical protein VGF20_02330 [Candidatus Acidoferrum sp.]